VRPGPYPVTLRQLQYVVAVADAKSFRRAAERCHVSQPSLSAQIAEVERALDVRLFERGRRGVLVTAAGAAVVEAARRVLLEVDDLVETARRVDPLSGTLRIGVIPTIGPYLLPDVDPALRATFPKLELFWREDKTETLVRLVGRGELDAALLALEADLGDLDHELVVEDPFLLAAAPSHPLAAQKGVVRMEQLRGEDVLLLDEGHCFREQALDLCARAGAHEMGFRATSLSTLAQMVAGGSGVTLLPRTAAGVENRRGLLALRAFADPAPHRTIVLAFRRKTALEEPLRRLAHEMRAALVASA